MKEKQTPLLRQYNQIKQRYPETILLFRLGDFFETFNDDAVITSKVCGIVLTRRNNGAAGEVPLAGFPWHQLDAYLPKLVRAGYRVAVCEQLEDPKHARGIVRRDVIEVVTPGVALYDKLLDTKKNNYLAAVALQIERDIPRLAAISAVDISTGEFMVCEIACRLLVEVLESLNPSEIIISKAQKNHVDSLLDKLCIEPAITKLEEWLFETSFGGETLLRHFKTKSLKGYGVESMTVGLAAAGAALHYVGETQKGSLGQITRLSLYNPSEFMALDFATRRNLEIAYSSGDGSADSSLISVLDKTNTAMGGRLLKKWLTLPLRQLDAIQRRLDSVRSLVERPGVLTRIRSELSRFSDLERLASKICSQRATPRDVVALKNSLLLLPTLKQILAEIDDTSLSEIANSLNPQDDVVALIEGALLDEPSAQIGVGTAFRRGFSPDLDEYVEAKLSARQWIARFQEDERQVSSIPSLKVGYNQVFGYYIEITHAHTKKVPPGYERKQTLTNAERYTTPELKKFESKILSAEEKISEIERRLFTELLEKIATQAPAIQDNAASVAALDCLSGFAQCSIDFGYCLPQVDESEVIVITDGRHPVVERLLPPGEKYTSNATCLDTDAEQIHIITGPNMSGKSCYLRQVGLIVLMAQVGCFVPASSARIGIVDRIFTRVGARDNITAGESTFLVEMQEAANIMNNATSRSLILLDEVGRGTATFDGISIAWAIAEYIHNKIRAKTLFATHYHELNELASRYDRIANYRVEVVEAGSTIVFTHTVEPGSSDHSFGLHVAKMAGMPFDVVDRASAILASLENPDLEEKSKAKVDTSSIQTIKPKGKPEQLAIFEFRDDALREKLQNIDINKITPIEALQVLSELTAQSKHVSKKSRRGSI